MDGRMGTGLKRKGGSDEQNTIHQVGVWTCTLPRQARPLLLIGWAAGGSAGRWRIAGRSGSRDSGQYSTILILPRYIDSPTGFKASWDRSYWDGVRVKH